MQSLAGLCVLLNVSVSHSVMLFMQVLSGLATASSNAPTGAALRQAVPQSTVVGIFRDLRGIAMATNSRRTYGEAHVLLLSILTLALPMSH